MITWMAKIFIRGQTAPARVRKIYGVVCGVVGIVLNALLFAGKFFAGKISGSIAITADAFNNLSDAGSSAITLMGFQLGEQKADANHPFGHGRIEYLSGLMVSMLILLMGFELAKSSVLKIFHPTMVSYSTLALVILLISVCVKLYMAWYNKKIGKKIDSAAIRATGMDSLSDSMATAAVLVAALVSRYTGLMIDGWVGVVVALFILRSGLEAAKDTIDPLLGQPPTPEYVKKITDIVMAHDMVLGVHDLIVHDYGPGRAMISLHAEVSACGDIMAIHDQIDNIESGLQAELGCIAVIHMDPLVTDDLETNETKQLVTELIQSIDEKIGIHDFRMVKGPSHTNLIFDAVLPFGYLQSNEEMEEIIKTAVRQMPGNYYAVVHVEHSFV